MTYKPFLISNIREARRDDVKPWLLPEQAWEEFTDCYLEDGVIYKRSGFSEWGRFIEAKSTIATVSSAAQAVVNSVAHGFVTGDLVMLTGVAEAGTVNYPVNGTVYAVEKVDNDNFKIKNPITDAYIITTGDGAKTGGIVSYIGTDTSDTAIDPITGIISYIGDGGTEALLVANKDRLCKWNDSDKYFEPVVDVAVVLAYGDGSTTAFGAFASLPWAPAEIISGSATITTIDTAGNAVTATDDGATPAATWAGAGIAAGTFTWATGVTSITFGTAPAAGAPIILRYKYYGDLWTGEDKDLFKHVNYDFIINNSATGGTKFQQFNAVWLTNGVDPITYWDGSHITLALLDPTAHRGIYSSTNKVTSCTDFGVTRERLVLYGVKEGTNWFRQRIRWPQAGAPTIWDDTVAGRGDYIDIATGDDIMWAKDLYDFIVVATQKKLWNFQYTGDHNNVFKINQRVTDVPTDARNAVVAFNEFVMGIGTKGIYAFDGNGVRSLDDKIKNFVITDFDQTNWDKVYAKKLTERNEVWIIYVPGAGANATTYPRKVLVWNYEDDVWYVMNIPFTCFGEHYSSGDKRLSDFGDEWTLNRFNEERLNSWFWQSNAPVIIGGTSDELGLGGWLWQMQSAAIDSFSDPIAGIASITNANPGVITTHYRHNVKANDSILIRDTTGISGLNENMFIVQSVTDTTITLENTDTTESGTHTADTGKIYFARPIDMSLKSAAWNPYNEEGKDTRLRSVDFYLNTDEDNEIKVDFFINEGTGAYQTKNLTFDGFGNRNWKRLSSGAIGNSHQIRIYDENSGGENVAIHALRLWVEASGRGVL